MTDIDYEAHRPALQALQATRIHLRRLQPALNVMTREVLDDIIRDHIDPVLDKETSDAN